MRPDFSRDVLHESTMSHEIHMFSAVAESATVRDVPAGEHRPMLIFLRQPPGTHHDMASAAAAAQSLGWVEVDITRAGTLPPDAGESMDDAVLAAYRLAVETGVGLNIFAAAVKPAPRKA